MIWPGEQLGFWSSCSTRCLPVAPVAPKTMARKVWKAPLLSSSMTVEETVASADPAAIMRYNTSSRRMSGRNVFAGRAIRCEEEVQERGDAVKINLRGDFVGVN